MENVWSAMINNKIQFIWTNPKTYFLVCLPTDPVICLLTFACYEKINWKSRKSYACSSTLFSFLTDQRVCFYICLLWFTMNHDLGVKYVGLFVNFVQLLNWSKSMLLYLFTMIYYESWPWCEICRPSNSITGTVEAVL